MKKVFKKILFLLVMLSVIAVPVQAAWWNEGYLNCKTFRLNESTGTDYNWTGILNFTGLTIQADGDDVRIIDKPCQEDGGEVPFGIVNSTATTAEVAVTLHLSANAENNFSIYYNNATATEAVYPTDLAVTANKVDGDWFYAVYTQGAISDFRFKGTENNNWKYTGWLWNVLSSNASTNKLSESSGAYSLRRNTSFYVEFISYLDGYTVINRYFAHSRVSIMDVTQPTSDNAGALLFTITPNQSAANKYCGYSFNTTYCSSQGATTLSPARGILGTWNDTTDSALYFLWDTADLPNSTIEHNAVTVQAGLGNRIANAPPTINTRIWQVWTSDAAGDESSRGNASKHWEQYVNNPPVFSLGTEESAASTAPNVTISQPTNITYLNDSVLLSFIVLTNNDPNADCYYSLDNAALVSIGTIANNTLNNTIIQNITHASHSLRVNCSDSGGNGTDIVYFSDIHYNVTNEFWQVTDYETNYTTITLNISTVPSVTSITGTLHHNYTDYVGVSYNDANDWMLNRTLQLPFLVTNNTVLPFNWTFMLTYSNTSTSNFTSDTHNNTVIWAYYLVSINSNLAQYYEGDPIIFNVMVLNYVNYSSYEVNSTYNFTNFNTSLDSITGNFWNYTFSSATPNLSLSETQALLTFNATYYVTFGGVTRQNNTANSTVFVYAMRFTNCSGLITNATTLNITSFDELSLDINDPTEIKSSVDVFFTAWGTTAAPRTFNFTFDNATSYKICIFPANANYTINATIQYNNETADTTREYYVVDMPVTNITSYINLYLLDGSLASRVIYTVKEASGQTLADSIVKIQRYFNGMYLTVAMIQSDDVGEGLTYLQPNTVFYKHLVELNSVLLEEFPPQKIAPDSTDTAYITLQLSGGYGAYYTLLSGVNGGCVYNSTTTVLRCTASDSTGTAVSTRLEVFKKGVVAWTTTCDTTIYNVAATQTCTLGSTVNGTFSYRFSMTTDTGLTYILATDSLFFGTPPAYSQDALLMGFLIVIMMAAVGLYNPAASMALGTVGLVASVALGLITVSVISLAGFVLVVAIILYKMKT